MFLWICQSLRPFSVLLFLGPPTLPLLCSLKTSVFVWGIGSTVLPSRKWNQHQYFGHFRNKGEFKNLEDCCFFLFGWNQCWGRWDSLNFLPADLLRSFLRFFSKERFVQVGSCFFCSENFGWVIKVRVRDGWLCQRKGMCRWQAGIVTHSC